MNQAQLDYNPLPVWICESGTMRVLRVNKAARYSFKCPESHWYEARLPDLFKIREFDPEISQYDFEFCDPDGASHTWRLSTNLIADQERDCVYVTAYPRKVAVDNDWRSVFNNVSAGIAVLDELGITSFANEKILELLELRPEDIYCKPFFLNAFTILNSTGTIFSDSPDPLESADINGSHESVLHAEMSSHARRYLRLGLRREFAPSGKRFIVTLSDVSKKYEAEIELKEKTHRLGIATSSTGVGIWEWSFFQDRVFLDSTVQKLFGMKEPAHELSFEDFKARVHPAELDGVIAEINECFLNHHEFKRVIRILRENDLKELSVQVHGAFFLAPDGTPSRMMGVVWDITDQKLAEEKLRMSEARYRSVVEDQPAMICRFNRSGMLTFVNTSFRRQFEYFDESVNPTFSGLLSRHGVKDPSGVLQKLFSTPITKNSFETKTENGNETRWIEWSAIPVLDESGKIYEIQAFGVDITDRKHLDLQRKRLDRIVRYSYSEIFLFDDASLTFEYANESALRNLGYTAEELKGMKITDLFHYPNEMALNVLLNTLKTNETDRLRLQMRHCRKDGSYYDIDTLLQYLEAENAFVAIGTDITGKLSTEKKLLATIREKELLLKEIHHRVKNNLQLISSIMYIKITSVKEPELKSFLNEMRQKIHSIGLIHERLLQSEKLDRVEMSDYLGKLIQGLKGSSDRHDKSIQIMTDIDHVTIDIDTAIFCALMVNELVTNSLKHAFKDRDEGNVMVRFKSKETLFVLSVSDDGQTIPAGLNPGAASSFGMNLIDILSKQIGGTINIIRSNGTTFEITFKRKK